MFKLQWVMKCRIGCLVLFELNAALGIFLQVSAEGRTCPTPRERLPPVQGPRHILLCSESTESGGLHAVLCKVICTK